MVRKADLVEHIAAFRRSLRDRIEKFLISQARSGNLGGVFGYSNAEGPTILAACIAELEAHGWTVVQSVPNSTLTIS